MDIGKVIKKAMVDKGIDGKMKLVELSGLSYSDITKIMLNDGSVKHSKVVEILEFFDYELTAEQWVTK